MKFGKALIKIRSNCLERYSRWNFSISSLAIDLELVPKNPTSRSFRSEASTYGLAPSGDGDNHRTCHITVYSKNPRIRTSTFKNQQPKIWGFLEMRIVSQRVFQCYSSRTCWEWLFRKISAYFCLPPT